MKRKDLEKILIIGAGPIVIGQACEFDYSGTQACKALKQIGHKVVLVNSNPATIMTDQDTADSIYIEPLTVKSIERIIEKERPNAVLGTLGGQTGLNLTMQLKKEGVLDKYHVEMIGANEHVINKAEDRLEFKTAMDNIGLESAKSELACTIQDARRAANKLSYPCVVRPAYTLGGTGGGIVYNEKELDDIVADGLRSSMISEVLIEESILGWKEYELEVMRDKNDNVVIICSIENLDPMGVHTGDSITVAPAQTLTDVEYQKMRNASIDIMREIGVETGGSNVQFAINPDDGRMIVIEMNPRVSRSSALASKATGFPIAKFAALLAVGYTLDEIQNDITKETPACFEPTIDYVVTKIPRFNFSKFPSTKSELGTAMHSVGEVMSIGRTFKESLQKGLRGLEEKRLGLGFDGKDFDKNNIGQLIEKLKKPNPERIFRIKQAIESGFNISQIHQFTKIDPWFLYQIEDIIKDYYLIENNEEGIRYAKQIGYSDGQLARKFKFPDEYSFRKHREKLGVKPVYKLVDTCAGEFEAYTPYYYSTYEVEDEVPVSNKKKVIIIGGGPNRIGQGIEFDYCCVHASMACRDKGYESIMVNSNPETVSTDFDTSDKLYFEPVTFEDVLNIVEKENPEGVIVQFGGQTPLNLANNLHAAGVKIMGTSPSTIDATEDREKFKVLMNKLNILQPQNDTATTEKEAVAVVEKIGLPVVVRPSYVLGGASMKICYTKEELKKYFSQAKNISPDHPILIDKYLDNAIEVDVDAVCDSRDCIVAGVMEHVEPAGIHSGDSACSLPPYTLDKKIVDKICDFTRNIALELQVVGLLNIQFAVKGQSIYMIEVNPRASRTVPFVSKSTGVQWAKVATRVMLGEKLKDMELRPSKEKHWSIKEAVIPFKKFSGMDPKLAPEMRSTGEVMGVDDDLGLAFLKAQEAAGMPLPTSGNIMFLYEKHQDKSVKKYADYFSNNNYHVFRFNYSKEIDAFDWEKVKAKINNNEVDLLISIPFIDSCKEESMVRRQANERNIPIVTTLRACDLALYSLASLRKKPLTSNPITSYYT